MARRRSRGQALTEFALIAPVLFLMLFGVIQLGLLMGAQNGLVDGVRDATRQAATYRVNEASIDDDSIFAAICTAIGTQLDRDLQSSIPGYAPGLLTTTIRYEWQQNPDTSQWFVLAHVTANYRNPLYVPLVSVFLDGQDGTIDNHLRLSASEQMRIENPSLAAPTTYTSGRTC